MRVRPLPHVSISRHGDKEQKLKDFILQRIAGARDAAESGDVRQLQVVARSTDSPVVKAIGSLAETIASRGFSVRMILAQVDAETLPDGWSSGGRAVAFEHEIRWARRPRLIEAHEQLVLGPQTCWIGDCMRRDPNKCDAYESYVEGCGEAAGCASVSFERLWIASEPLQARAAWLGGSSSSDAAPAQTLQ